jgi:hypothetical protein
MTVYTTISNALVAVGAKPFATTIQALRDNPLAIGEADSSVALNLLPTVLLGTITTTSGSSQSLSSLVLTPYRFLKLVFVGVSTLSAPTILFAAGQQVFAIGASGDTVRGIMEIDLSNGVFSSNLVNAAVNSSAIASPYAGDTATTNASTSVTVSLSGGSFDAGSVLVYGVK